MWVWLSLLWLGLPVLAIAMAALTTFAFRLILIKRANECRRVFE